MAENELQELHAEKIRAERTVMKMTGLSRTELRRHFSDDVKALQTRLAQTLPQRQEQATKEAGVVFHPITELPPHAFTTTQREQCGAGDTAQSEGGAGGTHDDPYVMGDDRTTIDPDPADDTWDITAQPTGKDGVKLPDTLRVVALDTYFGDYVKSVDFGGSTHVSGTILVDRYNVYTRPLTFDSIGRLVFVGAETAATLLSGVTIT